MRRAQWAWSALACARTRSIPLVGPWQYQSAAGWAPGGWRGSTHPVYPPSQARRYTRPAVLHRGLPRATGTWGHAHMAVLDRPKEILGVEYAQCTTGTVRLPHAVAVSALPPPYATAVALPLRLLVPILHYFSVFLSISQYLADPSISQISVYLRSQYISQIPVYLRS